MNISTLPITLTEDAAMKIAMKGGNLLGRLLYGKRDIQLKLMYLESKEIIYRMIFENALPFRRAGQKKEPVYGEKIRMIVEGTRCTPAYLDNELPVVKLDVEDDGMIQKAQFPDEKLISEGKYLARRMVRRQIGKTAILEVEEMRSVYRPYYIAFYGELIDGTKVRYLPIPADGNQITRSC